jgi:hypothetical protein
MEIDPNFNKIILDFVNKNIEYFYNTGKEIFKGTADRIRLHLDKTYKEYLLCILDRYTKTKSFFFRQPTSLYDFYVPLDILGPRTYVDNDGRTRKEYNYRSKASVLGITAETNFAVITGTGGTGKTMVMRHLILDIITQTKKIPVYLELKELNDSPKTITEFIRDALHLNGFKLDSEYIDKAINQGDFAFIFDGFDEVKVSFSRDVGRQIVELSKRYSKNLFFVASRPDDIFSGWHDFSVFKIQPLTLYQALELIEKLPFDTIFKGKFKGELRKNLYQSHKSFLSNPLLLSIMALTYDENADVPKKLSIFYNQAYEALFHRHDALKGDLKREKACNLDIREFAKVFGAFSLITYDRRKTQFTREDLLNYLENTKPLVNLSFKNNDFLKDALQAVCLFIEDGLFISFTHRSFQEYFAAKFISTLKAEKQRKVIRRCLTYRFTDSVNDLIYEMEPEIVERNCFLPILEELKEFLQVKNNSEISSDRYLLYLKSEFKALYFQNGEYDGYSLTQTSQFHHFLEYAFDKCGHLINLRDYSKAINEFPWQNYLDKLGNREINFQNLSVDSPILGLLSTNRSIFSKDFLKDALKLKTALEEKDNRFDESLNELLEN